MNDTDYMRLALELAQKGIGKTSPNPLVGAVIVKNGTIIGQGYHTRYGALHAEREAFASLTEPADGADLYVTLEPCCHYGNTPPCTDAIIENKVKRVFIATLDPNPLVGGKGAKILKAHGIEVISGLLEKEARELNRVFFHYITQKIPFITMKYAMSADGKIATHTGKSQWITSETARQHVHLLRNQYKAIMAGIGTVLADDPLLTCRIPDGQNPVRIICDTHCRMPLDSRIMKTAKEVPTYIACSAFSDEKRLALENMGAIVLNIPILDDELDLAYLIRKAGSLGIDSILVEGGGTLNESLLKTGLVTALNVYLAPSIIGGSQSKTPVEGIGVNSPDEAYRFELANIVSLGPDLLLEYIAN